MKFMTPNKYIDLINYIIIEPTQLDTDNRKYKYPFVSCELLCCDINQIYQAIFNYKNVIEGNNHEAE